MHVVEFLQALLLPINPKGVEAALTGAIIGIAVQAGRQPQAALHLAAPGIGLIFAQDADDALRRPFLELLHEAASALGRFRLDEHMEVRQPTDQHPTDKQKARLLPESP